MQFDLLHIYTVGLHTLFVTRNIRRLLSPIHPNDQPRLTRSVIERIPKLEILYLAGLFHDIAKGRGGDHSKLGASEARQFCIDHGFSEFDADLVAWLVRYHLKMSMTVQRQDIYDPEVINDFAEFVGDRMRLDYLFLLTVADIRGTNPKLWTSWKETLLTDLYTHTLNALRRDEDQRVDHDERIEATHIAALKLLHDLSVDMHAVRELWQSFQDDYFVRYRPEEIAWHSSVITGRGSQDAMVVDVREFPDRGLTELFIYCEDRAGLFATTTKVLDRLALDVTDARIMTLDNGYTLDTYVVLEEDSGEMVRGEMRREEIRGALVAALCHGTVPNQRLVVGQRRVRAFSVPTEVQFKPDSKTGLTRLSVFTGDRQGLLSMIGQAMQGAGIRLHHARVATFGERVEDFFYISDEEGRPFDDPAKQQAFVETFEGMLEAAK
jgi:[protein-PII] uridylyltransferase